jgi:hypothetical protein
MKVALQRAISLLRQNPGLWMPVIVATAVCYGIKLLREILMHQLLLALTTRHSALDGSPVVDLSLLRSPKIYVYTLPFWWFCEFLVIAIFAIALVMTARQVLKITSAKLPTDRKFLPGTLWFSAKVLIAYHLLTFLFDAPLAFIPRHLRFEAGWVLGICGQLILALIVATMAIRFLARMLHRNATPSSITLARWLGILTVAVSIALSFLVPRLEHPLFAFWPHMTQPAVQAILLAGEILSALPYAVLFVLLALLLRDAPSDKHPAFDPEPDPEPSPSVP